MRRAYDIDGVLIHKSRSTPQLHVPEPHDFIITGRSYLNAQKTIQQLAELGIVSTVYFNPLPPKEVNPQTAGEWKAAVIELLKIEQYFEDDAFQIEIIRARCPAVDIVHVQP